MAVDERPVSLPFVRSPSDVMHDRIKGEYTPKDAVTPGTAVGEEKPEAEDGVVDSGERTAQDTQAASAAETRRRVEDMSEVELDEAEARDRFAEKLIKDEDKDRLTAEDIPAVGGNPEDATFGSTEDEDTEADEDAESADESEEKEDE